MKKFINDFKAFISKGNVIDMAIGIVIGSAFSAIVNSLVKDIINPVIGFALAGVDFAHLKIVLKAATESSEEVAIMYGSLINAIVNFVIVALVIFSIIKAYERMKRKEEVEPTAEAPKGPTDNELLAAILSELKKK